MITETGETQKERIVAAAILQDGVVFTGTRHGFIIRDIVLMTGIKPVTGEQGFMTNKGRFVDRREAAHIAIDADQPIHMLRNADQLFSEDMWNIKREEGDAKWPTPKREQEICSGAHTFEPERAPSVDDANEFIAPLINEILLRLREDKKEIERLREILRSLDQSLYGHPLNYEPDRVLTLATIRKNASSLSTQLTVAREALEKIDAFGCRSIIRRTDRDDMLIIAASALSSLDKRGIRTPHPSPTESASIPEHGDVIR